MRAAPPRLSQHLANLSRIDIGERKTAHDAVDRVVLEACELASEITVVGGHVRTRGQRPTCLIDCRQVDVDAGDARVGKTPCEESEVRAGMTAKLEH